MKKKRPGVVQNRYHSRLFSCHALIAEAPTCFPWGYDEEDQRCVALKIA